MQSIYITDTWPIPVQAPFQRTALFRAFRAEVGTYVEIPEWIASDQFEIRGLFATGAAAGQFLLSGGVAGGGLELYVASNGTMQIYFNGSSGGVASTQTINDGALHSFRLGRTTGPVELFIDSSESPAVSRNISGSVKVARLAGRATGGFFLDGFLRAIHFSSLPDDRLYRNFTHPDGIVPNELGALGAELTTGAIRKAGGCALDGNTITNTNGGWGYLYEDIPVDIGQPYMIVAAADFSGDGDGWRLHVWENDNYVFTDLAKVDGLTDQVIALVTSSIPVIRVGIEYRGPVAGGQITKNLLSVREAPGYARLQNDADGSIFRYTKKGQAWLGPELITQAVWENPFSVGAEWSLVDNKWVLNGTGANSPLLLINTESQPDVMRLSGSASSVSGVLSVTSTTLPADSRVTEAGRYASTLSKAEAGSQQYKRQSGIVTAVLDKPSQRHKIPIAQGAES